MKIILLFLFLCFFKAHSQHNEYSVRDLKSGKFKSDSSFIYSLPYEKGESYFLIQAYHSAFSHKGLYALDFKMKEGSKICAARSGVVLSMRQDSDKRGLKSEMLSEWNYIIILHADGSEATYGHLKLNGALVNIGDSVNIGQPIGLSGNTGYSAFPHLHFEVTEPSKGQIPTRFETKNGAKYLRPGKWHKAK